MASDTVIDFVNGRRYSSRCLSVRLDGWKLVRCSWPWWHAKHSKWHCSEKSTGKVWRVRY